MHRHDTRLRPAFALGGTIMFLFVLLILIMVVRSFLIWSHLSTNPVPGGPIYGHQQAYNTGVKIGIWAAPIFGPLIVLAIAWFIGWLVSLMFGKSDDAGNIGAGIIMVAALALFGYSTYATAVAPSSPPPATTAGPPPPTAPAPSPLANQPPPPTIAPAPIVQAPPPVISEPGPPPQPITIAPPRPSSASPSAAKPPIDTTSAIEAVETPITQQLDDLIAVIDTFFPELAKRPPHEIRTINSRLESIKTLRAGAEAIKQPLEAAQTELKLRLIKLGMSEGDAQFESFKRIYQVFNSPRRKFGLDAVIRLCDKATEEHIFLRDNIAKWTIDSKGELVSKDIAFKQKAGSNHFFVKADAERPEFITKQLRGQ